MSALDDVSNAIARAVETVGNSLVRVEARAHRGATGVVWSDDGVIVTAHHVAERDENILVTLPDGKTAEATLVGRDPGTDVAVLRVDVKGLGKAPFVALDGTKVGHVITTLARPGRTVRAALGIIGALGDEYRTPAGGKLDRYVQTDTAPQHGFSGGVVVNLKGEVLGMNTAGIHRDVNVVVPTATLTRVVGEIVAHGQVRRGYLGVGVYPVRLTANLEQAHGQKFGLMVVAVEPGSPADQAGLFMGDVVLSIDGRASGRPSDLSALLEDRTGKPLVIKLWRAGSVRDASVTPGQRG